MEDTHCNVGFSQETGRYLSSPGRMLSVWVWDSARLRNMSTLRHLSNFTRHSSDKTAKASGGPTYEVEWTLSTTIWGLLFKSDKSLVLQQALPIQNPAVSAFTVAFQKAEIIGVSPHTPRTLCASCRRNWGYETVAQAYAPVKHSAVSAGVFSVSNLLGSMRTTHSDCRPPLRKTTRCDSRSEHATCVADNRGGRTRGNETEPLTKG